MVTKQPSSPSLALAPLRPRFLSRSTPWFCGGIRLSDGRHCIMRRVSDASTCAIISCSLGLAGKRRMRREIDRMTSAATRIPVPTLRCARSGARTYRQRCDNVFWSVMLCVCLEKFEGPSCRARGMTTLSRTEF